MTFNVRYGTAKDGPNHWELRKERCAARVIAFAPDLLGVQEALAFQRDFLLSKLPGFAAVGVAREDGAEGGEFSALLYRTERFALVDSGTFWLSETPDVPGSKSWDSSLPRIATWARLRERPSGRELLALNTHFDHRGRTARLEAARMIRAFVAAKGGRLPVIVTGDLNSGPGSEPLRVLLEPQPDRLLLLDAYGQARAGAPDANDGTAHGFREGASGRRIDWILHTAHFDVREALIDRTHEGPLFPSDHYPVGAVLSWR
jgi:endonuclease/exonuclease/phosphatase family metal-dependent hydrolase